ncbi:alpha-galactosidase [Nocardioides panacis]|uniref:alpha-galactosidase n=1 Tax=Nocardioides panacis TaxID=2849501 RepID=UPI0020B3DE6D|nr:alpha-galactosidase [Nocardioides panacis]
MWPDGLHPLVDHVRARGMQFGLWVEPEMVNPDSDLARDHPDWLLAGPDLLGPAHRQTHAVYRLMAELRAAHPGLEIESCSSGGGRVDLGVLEHTDRVWASDCIDPLERQQVQRWTGLLLPPELIGSHVGAPTSHTTGRTHTLDFRAGTAFFGHLGIEWDLAAAGPEERARLRAWVAAHRSLRDLLHTGTVVHADHDDPALWVHGVVAPDRGRAVYALVQTATSVQAPAGVVRLPGLDPDATYRLAPLAPGDRVEGPATSPLPWWPTGVELPGRVLGSAGVQAPTLHPERLVLVQATRTPA